METNTILNPLRNATNRGIIAGRLHEVRQRTFDIVAPQSALTVNDTDGGYQFNLDLGGTPLVTDEGVTTNIGNIGWTPQAWKQAHDRLGIPRRFSANMVNAGHTDVPEWLINTLAGRDQRTALYRMIRTDDGMVMRAMLSDSYRPIDNIDILAAALGAVEDNTPDGAEDINIVCDWSSDTFKMRITLPWMELAVPDLLGDYRTPWSMNPDAPVHARSGADGGDVAPVLWAGIEIGNSETGGGAFYVVPRAEVLVCRNGLRTTQDMVREVHLGQRLDRGVIDWSQETRIRQLELARSQVRDAVATFCSVEYLERIADRMRAAKSVAVTNPAESVAKVVQLIRLDDTESNSVLMNFARSGDNTVLGMAQAITATAQTVASIDRQTELEDAFWTIVGKPEMVAS